MIVEVLPEGFNQALAVERWLYCPPPPFRTGALVPRFHFHLEETSSIRDDQGVELADIDAARCHAVHMIAEVL